MATIKPGMIKFMSAQEIKETTQFLAKQIDRDYDGMELVIICPLKGSMVFAADFIRELTIPCKIDFVYLSTLSKNKTIALNKDLNINITGKHVLIVESIIDVGRKLCFLIERLQASNPASVRVATLIDKPARRELPIQPDYIGRTIEDRFIIGYGMDVEEAGRNYPDIYIFSS